MNIREGSPQEVEELARLDGSYTTDTVWQVEERTERGTLSVSFRPVRLPRAIEVPYPRQPKPWEGMVAGHRLLAAEEGGESVGYAYLLIQGEAGNLWVRDWVVDRPFRRRGIGTALLREAAAAAYGEGLRTMTLEMPTKDYPAIAYAQRSGFRFCGFVTSYYPNGDIGVFFVRSLSMRGFAGAARALDGRGKS